MGRKIIVVPDAEPEELEELRSRLEGMESEGFLLINKEIKMYDFDKVKKMNDKDTLEFLESHAIRKV